MTDQELGRAAFEEFQTAGSQWEEFWIQLSEPRQRKWIAVGKKLRELVEKDLKGQTANEVA